MAEIRPNEPPNPPSGSPYSISILRIIILLFFAIVLLLGTAIVVVRLILGPHHFQN